MRVGALVLVLTACGRFGFDPAESDDARTGDALDASEPFPRFALRKPLSIDVANNLGGVDLADFPLAVSLTDADLRMASLGGKLETGFDLGFVDGDGVTPLSFEIDRLDLATGSLTAWVKLPVLSASANTTLHLVFGDAMATSGGSDGVATWADRYVGVWHFSEPSYSAPGNATDATGTHPATAVGAVTAISGGRFGRAAEFGGNCAHVSIAASAALQPPSVTVSAWVRPADIGSSSTDRIATILSQDVWRATGTGSQGYYLEIYRTLSQPEPSFYAANGPTYAHAFATGTGVANGTWHHIVGTFDAANGTASIYLDGAIAGTASMTGPIDYLSKPVQIGCSSSGWWIGAIDEVMISSSVHSAAQIVTEHANQLDPVSFVSVGATEPAR